MAAEPAKHVPCRWIGFEFGKEGEILPEGCKAKRKGGVVLGSASSTGPICVEEGLRNVNPTLTQAAPSRDPERTNYVTFMRGTTWSLGLRTREGRVNRSISL